jgi:membrane-associated phospholipid phosphatase
MFLSLALLAIAQRLLSAAHYASDLVAGFTITTAIACAWIWLANRRVHRVTESERESSFEQTEA